MEYLVGRKILVLFRNNKDGFFLAILALYLHRKLHFDQSSSTAIYHSIELLAYSFTIVGAIIADSWLGIYRTILSMTLVFAVGTAIVAFAAIELLNLPIV